MRRVAKREVDCMERGGTGREHTVKLTGYSVNKKDVVGRDRRIQDNSFRLRTRRPGVRIPPGAPHFVMFHVYVLRSETTGRFYVGYTSDLPQRLGQHNHGITKSTKNRGPWGLVHQETFSTRSEAMRRERFLKTGQGREELKAILASVRSSAG